MRIPLIEQVKIQAQMLVPLLKTLRAELGEEKADALKETRSNTRSSGKRRSHLQRGL